jgi:competence protein ComEC
MPFWDRSIELVILTHPQKDHFGGLIDVFRRYKVGHFVANNINSGGQEYEVLKKLVGGMNAAVHNPTSDMQMRLGLMYLEVVWPTDEFLTENTSTKELAGGINLELNEEGGVLGEATTSRDPNDFSVVTVLRLGEFDALLTGDIQPPVINRVVEIIGESYIKEYEYIKVPHHGSKNGLIKELLEITDPQIAVISVGRKNRYGHPHQETLEILGYRDIRILRTDKDGDVEIVSDGKEWWIGD